MIKIACIVEGEGEVTALPVLLRALGNHHNFYEFELIKQPYQLEKHFIIKPNDPELASAARLLADKIGDDHGWILVLFDADDDCPVKLAAQVRAKLVGSNINKPISIVVANREYESWFIAARESLYALGKLIQYPPEPTDSEAIRGAKEWLQPRMPNKKYRETRDQAVLSAIFSLEEALQNSQSFRKLVKAWKQHSNIEDETQP